MQNLELQTEAVPTEQIPERFFQHVWKLKLFDLNALSCHDGQELEILYAGTENRHSGADFQDARLRIGGMLWAGAVEIHRRASEWNRHGHQRDAAYDNVILHVVYENDAPPLLRSDGSVIATLELRGRIAPDLVRRYWTLLQPSERIPCERSWQRMHQEIKVLWLERLAVERLEQKTERIETRLQQNQNDWEQTFYESVARSLGGKVNAEAMERLARSLPQRLPARHKDDLLQLEALFLGQAGLLDHPEENDEQLGLWRREWKHLQAKYGLIPLPASVWKFARMRPQNFPTLRIAQLARLTHGSSHLFSRLLQAEDLEAVQACLRVELDGYWLNHFIPGRPSPRRSTKTLGKDTVDSIVINTLAPFLFAYGRSTDDPSYIRRALNLLEKTAPEQNAVIELWQELGERPPHAAQTQALLQLKQDYCDRRRCLDCALGHALLRSGNAD